MSNRLVRISLIKAAVALLLCASQSAHAYDPLNRSEYLAKIQEAKAYFKEKCEKVAGIRIYKTVPDVEGVLLLKIRPERRDRELADPNWPGAVFGHEVTGDSYIASFIGNEVPSLGPIGANNRGHIVNEDNLRPGGRPGYLWVEAIDPKDGQRYRYTGSRKPVGKKNPQAYKAELEADPNYDMNIYRWSLDRISSPSKIPPRYAVTFEDHVIPEERALWVASGTVKVLDLMTNETMGEMTIYGISYIHAPRFSMPWLNHTPCGHPLGTSSQDSRKFVDQVLIPKGQPPFVETQSKPIRP